MTHRDSKGYRACLIAVVVFLGYCPFPWDDGRPSFYPFPVFGPIRSPTMSGRVTPSFPQGRPICRRPGRLSMVAAPEAMSWRHYAPALPRLFSPPVVRCERVRGTLDLRRGGLRLQPGAKCQETEKSPVLRLLPYR